MKNREMKPVYAMMVTGKDRQRIGWAQRQVHYFLQEMNYPADLKYMLIANEHPSLSVCKRDCHHVQEFQVEDRNHTTLGEIRNQLITHVPKGSYCFVLDDDDYLDPDWILRMLSAWPNDGTALIQFSNRLNHNLLTHSSWKSHFRSGFVHFLGDVDRLRAIQFRYASQNTLEDLVLHRLQIGKQRHVWTNNDPALYVRYVHNNNTSVFVDSKQSFANQQLGESQVTSSQHQLCLHGAPDALDQNLKDNWCRNISNTLPTLACVSFFLFCLFLKYRSRLQTFKLDPN